jgi:hypothetical protein
VLNELKARLPKNEHRNRRAKLWQLLTVDSGIPHLDRQLTADLTLMQISESKQQFEDHWDKLYGKQPLPPGMYTPKELGHSYFSVASLTIRAAAWFTSSRVVLFLGFAAFRAARLSAFTSLARLRSSAILSGVGSFCFMQSVYPVVLAFKPRGFQTAPLPVFGQYGSGCANGHWKCCCASRQFGNIIPGMYSPVLAKHSKHHRRAAGRH